MGSGAAIRLSVVIAQHGVTQELRDCLRVHASELEQGDELVAVVAADADECARLAVEFERAVIIAAPLDALTPQLWSIGIRRARGEFVRITIGSFIPLRGWRDALCSAFEGGSGSTGAADVVGGPMEPAQGLRWRELAIYFQRYRNFHGPFERHEVQDVPADHSAYRREALEATADLWADEFWERDVNAVLARGGRRLVLDPHFPATYCGGESAGRFVVQRYRHGIQFGRARITGRAHGWRALYVLAFLLPGLVFFARIARESLSVRGSARRFVAAAGWLALFVVAWSLGEWTGALLGPLPTRPRPAS